MEEQGLLLSNGQVITTQTNPLIGDDGHAIGYDSDGDGLSDGEELGTMIRIVQRQVNGEWELTCTIEGTTYTIPNSTIASYLQNMELDFYVFNYVSNPNMKDTDGDSYEDPNDPRPRYNDIITIDLGGGRYDPAVNDEGYIHVKNVPFDGKTIVDAYGGNQSWFGNVSISLQGINLLMEDTGCGVIAANDVELYLRNGASSYNWPDYRDSVMNTFSGLSGTIFTPIPVNIVSTSAISPSYIKNYYLWHGILAEVYSISNINKTRIKNKISRSLKNNKPVILMENDRLASWGLVNRNNPYKLRTFDSNSGDFLDTDEMMLFHYVTITGMYQNRIMDKTYLRVQSWGDEYYIDYDEFYDYNQYSDMITWSGDLLFIE